MGVATADPQYMPPVGAEHAFHQAAAGESTHRTAAGEQHRRKVIHSDRYLQTPKAGKAIFTSREERARRTMRRFFATLICAAIVLTIIWLFFIR